MKIHKFTIFLHFKHLNRVKFARSCRHVCEFFVSQQSRCCWGKQVPPRCSRRANVGSPRGPTPHARDTVLPAGGRPIPHLLLLLRSPFGFAGPPNFLPQTYYRCSSIVLTYGGGGGGGISHTPNARPASGCDEDADELLRNRLRDSWTRFVPKDTVLLLIRAFIY